MRFKVLLIVSILCVNFKGNTVSFQQCPAGSLDQFNLTVLTWCLHEAQNFFRWKNVGREFGLWISYAKPIDEVGKREFKLYDYNEAQNFLNNFCDLVAELTVSVKFTIPHESNDSTNSSTINVSSHWIHWPFIVVKEVHWVHKCFQKCRIAHDVYWKNWSVSGQGFE